MVFVSAQSAMGFYLLMMATECFLELATIERVTKARICYRRGEAAAHNNQERESVNRKHENHRAAVTRDPRPAPSAHTLLTWPG